MISHVLGEREIGARNIEQYIPERDQRVGDDVGNTKPQSRERVLWHDVLEHHDRLQGTIASAFVFLQTRVSASLFSLLVVEKEEEEGEEDGQNSPHRRRVRRPWPQSP